MWHCRSWLGRSFPRELDHLRMREWGQGGGLSRGSREEVVRASWRSKGAQSDSRARRGGSDCRAIWGDASANYSGPSLIRPVLAAGPAAKDAGHRDECRDGLLFPPEQLLKCTLSERIQAEFLFVPRANCAGWTWLAPHVAVIRSSSEYSKILMICDGSQKPPPLTCWNGMDLEEVGAQR